MEELRQPEVGLPQLGCLVLPVGLTRRRRRMTFRVQRHPDAREVQITRDPQAPLAAGDAVSFLAADAGG